DAALGGVKACGPRRRLAEVAAEADAAHVGVLLSKILDGRPRAVAATVIDKDHLDLQVLLRRHRRDLLEQQSEALLLVVHWNDERNHVHEADARARVSSLASLALRAERAGNHQRTAQSASSATVHSSRSNSTTTTERAPSCGESSSCKMNSRTPRPPGAGVRNAATYEAAT